MKIQAFYDKATFTLTYLIYDPESLDAVIIDPVLNFDMASGKTSLQAVHELHREIEKRQLKIHYILETHAHADHLSGALELKKRYYPTAKIAIGENIRTVQSVFKEIFNFGDGFKVDGSQFDHLIQDNEVLQAGSLQIKAIFTPGHTPACSSYLIEDALFTGDALFMPDFGTGRCDFPAGSAKDLYHSVTQRIYSLPDNTRVFVGHDYQPGGRELAFETTVGESKQKNVQLRDGMSEEEFVNFRSERDRQLDAPKLLYPSVQVNIAAGEFPMPENNGQIYLKIPVQYSS